MSKNDVVRLTSAEMSAIWTSYMSDSMAICVINYFLAKAEDKKVQSILKYALELAETHVNELEEIFKKDNHPIPQGFTKNDVDTDAPRLFSDTFALIYLQNMSRLGLTAYAAAYPLMARKDVNTYYHKCVDSSAVLSEKVTEIMLEKGIYSRSPYISVPARVEFIEKQTYKNGIFGKQRPLTGVEATDIFLCLMSDIFSKVLLTGYSQTAQSKEVKDYMYKGTQIASKQIEVLGGILKNDNLSSPQTWDSEVTEHKAAPFSDKLMMYHSRLLAQMGISNFGVAISTAMRHDLMPVYTRLAAEMGKYGEEALTIMIKHKWLEKPPDAADRDLLAKG